MVDNRAGAGGTLGAAHVAQQPPDGYTLMLSNTAPIVTSPPLYTKAGLRPGAPFTHIALVGTTPAVIIANPSVVPATDFAGLIAWIKAQPQPPAYGTSGNGSVGHVLGEMFERETGVDAEPRALPRLRADAGGPARRQPSRSPSTRCRRTWRTSRPAGCAALRSPWRRAAPWRPRCRPWPKPASPGCWRENWLGLSAPAGLPAPIVQRLHAETLSGLETPFVRQRLDEHGIASRPMSPANSRPSSPRRCAPSAA